VFFVAIDSDWHPRFHAADGRQCSYQRLSPVRTPATTLRNAGETRIRPPVT